jgi:hypothetical protein
MKANTQFKKTCNAVASCLAFRAELALHPSKRYLERTWLDVTTTSLVMNLHRRTLRKMVLRGELLEKREAGTAHYRAMEIVGLMKR